MSYKLPPLYAFSLPSDLIPHLQPRQLVIPIDHPLHPSNQLPATTPQVNESQETTPTLNGAYTCALTGASFSDRESLKRHYKSDWYNYNVKLRLQGKQKRVSEEEFNQLVENLSDSISGSESVDTLSDIDEDASTSTDSSVGGGTISRLLKKQNLSSRRPLPHEQADDEGDEFDPSAVPRTALLWFEAPTKQPDTQFGIYRAALPMAGGGKKRQDGPEVLEELKSLQLSSSGGAEEKKERKWTLLMFGGGHFAGMVVSLAPKLVSKGKGKEKEKELVILHSKTFHRYTTRRKQGGSQGANDNANGKAKSAGAQIRRHNEAALTQEVRGILNEWRQDVDDSELIFLRCSKSYYKTFMGYDDAVLTRGDPRIRGYTFPTRRPTINELVRAFTELTKVKTSHLTSEALAELDASYLASVTPRPTIQSSSQPDPTTTTTTTSQKKVPVKLTKLEELERDRWNRLIEMVRKGKIELVKNFLDKYGPELESQTGGEGGDQVWGSLPIFMEDELKRGEKTLLHVASAADQPGMVRWLLEEKRADPTLHASVNVEEEKDERGEGGGGRSEQTPYELARSRATRNVFRFLTMQHPDWWDWTGTGIGGARVPSGLDEAKELEKEAKEEAKREKLREKQREREQKEMEEFEAREEEKRQVEEKERKEREARLASLPTKGPQRLGGGPPMPIRERQMGGLSDEQKMRIAREERARAAEARLKRLG